MRQRPLDPEIEKKFQQIVKRSGIITIVDEEYKTDIKDLEDLGELGNGTSGHVVKMRHTPTNKVIAVKVRLSIRLTLLIVITASSKLRRVARLSFA